MKRLILILSVLFIFGCTPNEPNKTGATFSGNVRFEKLCIDGVEYLHRNRGGHNAIMSPHFKPDGTLYTCNE